MSEIDFELEYKGGGYFREKGVDIGVSARVVHGKEILDYIATLKRNLATAQARIKELEEQVKGMRQYMPCHTCMYFSQTHPLCLECNPARQNNWQPKEAR